MNQKQVKISWTEEENFIQSLLTTLGCDFSGTETISSKSLLFSMPDHPLFKTKLSKTDVLPDLLSASENWM